MYTVFAQGLFESIRRLHCVILTFDSDSGPTQLRVDA